MTSTQLVFSIPELLEKILLYVPERDLLLSQRVNQTFRNVTKHSPQLQRKLFYTADTYQERDLLRELKWNPLLHAFHPYKRSNTSIRRRFGSKLWQSWRNLSQSNQLSREDFVEACTPGIELEVLRKVNYPTASWKKMYFTHPAVSRMTTDVEHPDFPNPGHEQLTHIRTDNRSGFTITHCRKGEVSFVWESMLRLR